MGNSLSADSENLIVRTCNDTDIQLIFGKMPMREYTCSRTCAQQIEGVLRAPQVSESIIG